MKKNRGRERNEELWSRFYEDYEYSKKLLGTVSGAGEIRVMSSMYAPNHCHYLSPFSLVQIMTDTSVTD